MTLLHLRNTKKNSCWKANEKAIDSNRPVCFIHSADLGCSRHCPDTGIAFVKDYLLMAKDVHRI